MKRMLYFVMIIISILIFSACSAANKINKTTSTTSAQKGTNSLKFKENLLLANKPVLNISYNNIIKNFGKPAEVKTEKISFPAADFQDYNYVGILLYDGVNFEFDLGPQKSKKPIEECTVWRFDITGDKYSIGDLKVGMSIEEYQKKFTDSKIYTLSDLSVADTNKLSTQDAYKYSALQRILITSKPKNYYNMYNNVSYQQGVLADKNGESIAPLGFAILFKNNKINRIVYGSPTAG